LNYFDLNQFCVIFFFFWVFDEGIMKMMKVKAQRDKEDEERT